MIVTQYKLLQTIPALQILYKNRLPFKTAYSIYNLSKKANECKEFFIDEEKKLIEECHGIVNEQGQISFKEDEDFKNFSQKYEELQKLEVEIEDISIKISDLENIDSFYPGDVEALDGIIKFIG